MDGCWHDSFYHYLEHICGDTFDSKSVKDVIDCKRQGFMGATNVVNYLTNHDHNHLMVELGDREIFRRSIQANQAEPSCDGSRRTTDLDGRRVW